MGAISVVQKSITVVLVVTAVVLVVGQALGQPLLLGYVATGSMEPTIAVGDGFIAIPTILAGDISSGDVITYEAQQIQGGGPTTHRVIEETPQGYITQGDANSFTDQAAGEPPVTEAQIYAVVLQLNGKVVVLPSLGAAATAAQNGINSVTGAIGVGSSAQIGVATSGFGMVLITLTLLYGFLTSEHSRQTKRSTSRSEVFSGWLIVGGLIVIVALPLMTSMVIPSGTTTINLLSTETGTDIGSGHIAAGDSAEFSYAAENTQYLPKVVIVESAGPGVKVHNTTIAVSHGERETVDITVTAPETTGPFARSRTEQHYFHILPIPIIRLLHVIHPLVAMVTISLVVTAPVIGLYAFFVGIRPISVRSTQR